jgi:hypothetical protein
MLGAGPQLKESFVKTPEELALFVKREEILEVPGSKELLDSKYFDGSYTQDIMKYLPSSTVLSPAEQTAIEKGMKKKSTGLLSSVPLNCSGPKCPFNKECPFFKVGKAPIGFACPVESIILDLYTKRYIDEFGVIFDSFSETTTMTMLAATHIMEMRAWKVLGEEENASGIVQNVVGYNEDEEPIIQQQEHPAYDILERAWRWREKLLISLVGTRKEKYKREAALKEKPSDNSLSKRAAEIKAKIDKLSLGMEQL